MKHVHAPSWWSYCAGTVCWNRQGSLWLSSIHGSSRKESILLATKWYRRQQSSWYVEQVEMKVLQVRAINFTGFSIVVGGCFSSHCWKCVRSLSIMVCLYIVHFDANACYLEWISLVSRVVFEKFSDLAVAKHFSPSPAATLPLTVLRCIPLCK